MLTVEGLRHVYDGRTVLEIASWRAAAGARWAVRGPSGAGKSTFLHILAGLLTPTAGQVTVAGTNLAVLTPAARDRFRGATIGIVFQKLHLLAPLTALENVTAAQRFAGRSPDADAARAALTRLGVGARAEARADLLSQGEAQRVAIARAVVNRPKLILADEPTAALDDEAAASAAQLLIAAAEDTGATLVVATHDARLAPFFPEALGLERPR